MSNDVLVVELGGGPVAKKKNRPSPGTGGKQLAFRAPDELLADLSFAADGLGLDLSNLIRMVLVENIRPYVERAREVLARRENGED
jgi:hypothetical protein